LGSRNGLPLAPAPIRGFTTSLTMLRLRPPVPRPSVCAAARDVEWRTGTTRSVWALG